MKSKKCKVSRFLNYKSVKSVLGPDYILDSKQTEGLELYFEVNDFRKSQDYFPRIAHWIYRGISDIISTEKELISHNRMSEEYFIILYGEVVGKKNWKEVTDKAKTNLSTSVVYWTNKGYSISDASKKIIEHQKHASNKSAKNRNHTTSSIRCKEYWMEKGYDIDTAIELVSEYQKRNLPFYIEKYGVEEGNVKYYQACNKRKNAWKNKTEEELIEHAIKTRPKWFNPDGQEMQAVNLFIKQNKIDPEKCMFGSPDSQFYQWIPDVGFRRYDLAVFSDASKTELKIIMEFHGPGHINFSDYSPAMKNQTIISKSGKELPHLGTYGKSYTNDYIKRKHILEKYNSVQYCVYWVEDLKNKNLRIKNDL